VTPPDPINVHHVDDNATVIVGDCLQYLRELPDNSVDMVMCSPPYEDARTYGIDFKAKGEEWVKWAMVRYLECYRICRGLVCWVVEGRTRDFAYSATPLLLAADLHRYGVKLRKPVVYGRVGIPGSGGTDWLRNDWEPMICATHGKLPWSDNTVCGTECSQPPGGRLSNRTSSGERVHGGRSGEIEKQADGRKGIRRKNGELYELTRANPGNVCWVGAAGGGKLGSKIAHENEAPYPEFLCNFIIRTFCPPGGTVLDPFCGSGTTLASAIKNGRKGIGIDIRQSMAELTVRRLAEIGGAK